jgi:spoIIIJ-associated protein
MNPQAAKQLIEELLQKLCVSFESIEETEDAATKQRVFMIESADSKLLIGAYGEHLAALNQIARSLARQRIGAALPAEGEEGSGADELNHSGGANFSIDVNNYRRERVESVLSEARAGAERARLFHRPVELSPMSSYERLVVHSALGDMPDITTESFGEGRFRRVVVKVAESTKEAT